MAEADAKTVEALVRWHAGDAGAIDSLIEVHLPWMRQFVRHRLGHKLRMAGDTEDFVQAAMVGVLRYGPRFQVANAKQFRGLLGRIIENQLHVEDRHMKRHMRDYRRRQEIPSDSVLDLSPAARDVTRPSQALERNEREAWVQLGLEFLSAADREVIILYEWEGLNFREIGERLTISEDAARMRFQRALPRLGAKIVELRNGNLDDLLVENDGEQELQ